MNISTALAYTCLLLVLSIPYKASAAVRYVSAGSANPTAPYISWTTAAVSIQDAVDAADAGDLVLVTNGVYETGGRLSDGLITNRLVVSKALTVQSVNGPAVTVIKGYQLPGTTNGASAVRCVYLTNDSVLIGFTLTNGATLGSSGATEDRTGGGLYCASTSAMVSNCVITGNSASLWSGGAWKGSLYSCTVMKNSAMYGGGVASSTLSNCVITANRAQRGGGVVNCNVSDCALTANVASDQGGGAYMTGARSLTRCILSGNSAMYGGGASGGTLIGCVLTGNAATLYGGGTFNSSLYSCTVRGNTAQYGGGVWGYFAGGTLVNSIIYDNTPANLNDGDEWVIRNCCTTPMPTNGVTISTITSNPLLISGSNLRLQSNSPCVNAGNNALVSTSTDLDGNTRISAGTVDIGAYEFESPASVLSYAWAQAHGLPTDGTADFIDTDDDGSNNWEEWRAATIPNDPASRLELLYPTRTNSVMKVTWYSVVGVTYYLERAVKLDTQVGFLRIASNIVGQAETTTCTDAGAVGAGPFFYRVGVH